LIIGGLNAPLLFYIDDSVIKGFSEMKNYHQITKKINGKEKIIHVKYRASARHEAWHEHEDDFPSDKKISFSKFFMSLFRLT
jgi:hypothetical protein